MHLARGCALGPPENQPRLLCNPRSRGDAVERLRLPNQVNFSYYIMLCSDTGRLFITMQDEKSPPEQFKIRVDNM